MKTKSVFGVSSGRSNSSSQSTGSDKSLVSTTSDSVFASFDSYIIEKLVAERLKLGIVKTKQTDKRDTQASESESTIVTKKSSTTRLSILDVCFKKYENRDKVFLSDSSQDFGQPAENPANVIQPDFSERDDDLPDLKDPLKDVLMQLNRSRSFYTPRGYRDHRIDLKRLEAEGENIWAGHSDNRFTKFLFEEAIQPLKNMKHKAEHQEDESIDGDIALRNIDSLISMVKIKELPPSEWNVESIKRDKFTPYWAYAPEKAVDRTINKIRYIYTILKDADLRGDKKKKKFTGKVALASRLSDEEEAEIVENDQEEINDEPYFLKTDETWPAKRAKPKSKAVEEELVEDEEIQELEIRSGHHNIQEGHELSISNIQKTYPPTPPSSGEEEPAASDLSFVPITNVKESSIVKTISSTATMMRSSWIKKDELEEPSSDESLYDLTQERRSEDHKDPVNKPCIKNVDGFPLIVKQPKWIPLQRECIEKEGDDWSYVERYRCLCVNRGIPPCEAVARSINKKSAVMKRMGRGPSGTIQTMAEVLGAQTRTINLSGFYMTKNDVCQLVKSLHRFVNLAKLQLSRTKMTGEMLTLLINHLKKCEKLCFLDVSYNDIAKVTPAMIRGLPPTLAALDLSHCDLGNDSFKGLAQLNPAVKSLNLSWNRLVDPAGLRFLMKRLIRRRSKMRDLRLSWNSIKGEIAARAISELPRTAVPIVFLDLSYNKFGSEEEMLCFNEMLRGGRKLKYFLLGGNPLTDEGSSALIKDLQWTNKPPLRIVDLGDLWIDKALYTMCEEYYTLYDVEMRIGGIKGNIELKDIDMAEINMRRFHFLNAPKKKKKKKKTKDLATYLIKLMDTAEVTRMRRGKVLTFLEDQKFKIDDGLLESLTKSLSDSKRMIDLEAAVEKYRSMFPEEEESIKVPKPRKKTKTERIDDNEPIVDLFEPSLIMDESEYNLLFIEQETNLDQVV